MNGEYGTSENGVLNFYYKCSGRKRFKTCDKNNLKKDEIENLIINSTLEIFQSRSNIEFFADAVMETHRTRLRNQTVLNLLISDRSQKQRALENVMRVIEDGVYTATTKNRLQTLEEEIQVLNDKIIAEQCKLANEMKREDVIKYLENTIKNESQLLLDIFVQKVIVYEESVKVYYNYIENRNPDDPSVDSREFSLYGQKFTVTETALIVSFLFENTLR